MNTLASKFVCNCGEIVRTNLYEGRGVFLLVPEQLTDVSGDANLNEVLGDLVDQSDIVAICGSCRRLHVIDNKYTIKTYENTEKRR